MNEVQSNEKKRVPFWQNKMVAIYLIIITLFVMITSVWAVHRVLSITAQLGKVVVESSTNISVFSVAESLHRQSKLIVQTALITVDQTLEKENVLSLGGFAFEFGSSNLRMVSMGNKVQYYIPMHKISDNDILWDSETETLTIRVPLPTVDSDMIELQDNPRQIIFLGENSWYDWASGNGVPKLTKQAQNNMREYVLRTARTHYYMSLAKENAQRELERLLETIVRPINPQARFIVEFKEKSH